MTRVISIKRFCFDNRSRHLFALLLALKLFITPLFLGIASRRGFGHATKEIICYYVSSLDVALLTDRFTARIYVLLDVNEDCGRNIACMRDEKATTNFIGGFYSAAKTPLMRRHGR